MDDALDKQVERLERRTRSLTKAVAIEGLALAFTAGIALVALLNPALTGRLLGLAPNIVADQVSARRFLLIGKEGQAAGVFGFQPKALYPQLVLAAGGAYIQLNFEGAPRPNFGGAIKGDSALPPALSKPIPAVRVYNDSYVEGFGIHNSQAAITIGDRKENSPPRLFFGIDLNHEPSLEFFDSTGRTRAAVGDTTLTTYSTGSREYTGPSSMTLFDKDGNLLWRAPE
jgi:hypothetical protein